MNTFTKFLACGVPKTLIIYVDRKHTINSKHIFVIEKEYIGEELM